MKKPSPVAGASFSVRSACPTLSLDALKSIFLTHSDPCVCVKLGSVRNGERFAYVDDFKGTTLVSFREFYNADDGNLKPGSKGTYKGNSLKVSWKDRTVLTFLCSDFRYLPLGRSIQATS